MQIYIKKTIWAFFFEIISKYFLGFDYRRLQYASNFEQENGSKDKQYFDTCKKIGEKF